MILKRLKKLIFIISMIIVAALPSVIWCVGTESGLNMLFDLVDSSEFNMPLNIYFNEVHGSLLRGFTISGITVLSGDAVSGTGRRSLLGSGSSKGLGTEKLLEIVNLTLGFGISLSEKSIIVPRRVMIEGVESDFKELSSLLNYSLNTFGGGGSKPILLDFILKSGDINNIPNMEPVSIKEISLSRNGELKLDISVGKANISSDQVIPLEQYFDLRINSIDIKLGSAGRINLDLAFTPSTTINTDFKDIEIADLRSMFKVSFDADGVVSGNAHVRILEQEMSASGDLNIIELKLSGVPISSFSLPWNYNDKDKVLKFPRIGATMSGMENLKGWAFVNTQSTSGTFFLSGENLSLSDLERTFKLGYPVEGENGSFRARIEFEKDSILGSINVKIPSVTIEKQKIDDVSLGISLKNEAIEGDFKANLFGAPVSGSGYFSFEPPHNIRLNSVISGVESSRLVFFVPSMADAYPQGKITADIKLNGTLDSIHTEGVIKSDRLSIYGLNLQKFAISLNSKESDLIDYKITSSGGVVLNTSGQISFLRQEISGNGTLTIDAGSIPALKGSGSSGRINSNFKISGNFSDPVANVEIRGKNNVFVGMPVSESSISVRYSQGALGITDSTFKLDSKGFIWVKGNISLLDTEPEIDIYGTVKNFPLASYGINEVVNGQFKVKGAVSNANITGNFTSPAANGDSLNVAISGNTKAMKFEIKDAVIAGGRINGIGHIGLSGKSPSTSFDIDVVNVRMHDLYEPYKIESPIGGMFTGKIKARGTVAAPEVELTSQFPLTLNKILLDKLSIKLSAGKRDGEFALSAKALLGGVIALEFSGRILKKKDGWSFVFGSNNINVDELVQVGYPSLRGNFAGNVKLLTDIELPNGKITYTLESMQLEAFGFLLRGLRVPFEHKGDEIKFKVDRGNIGRALIFGDGAIDLNRDSWKASFSINDIHLEELAERILSPRGGKLTGKGEARFDLNGNIGIISGVYGMGSFKASNGALEGLEELEKINKERKFEFDSINGGFFFNGKEVHITSGTSINAPPGDRLYRYIRFSGPLGMSGSGMNLKFSARIDIDVLNVLIGAFEGLISLASGRNALLNPTKAIAEKVLGIKVSSFNDVTFELHGGWGNPVLSNLKIERQLTGAKEWGKNVEEGSTAKRRVNVKVNVPVGPGGSDTNFKDALRQGIFDALFDSVAP